MAILRQGAQATSAHENESDHAILTLGREFSDFHVNKGNLCCTHWIYLLFCGSVLALELLPPSLATGPLLESAL
jgi:hypothetical protein